MTQTAHGSSLSDHFIRLAHPARTAGTIHHSYEFDDFVPTAPDVSTPHVMGFTDLQQEATTDLGGQMAFTWNYNSEQVIINTEFFVHFSQINAGVGGLNPRYPDDPISHCIEECYWEVNGRRIETLRGDQIHFEQLLNEDPDTLARNYAKQRAGLTVAQRTALATAVGGFWAILHIPYHYTKELDKALQQWSLSHDIRFVMRLRPATFVLQDDNGIAPTQAAGAWIANDTFLRCRVNSTTSGHRKKIAALMASRGTFHPVHQGVVYKIDNTARTVDNSVLAAATVQTINLTQIVHTCYKGWHITRPAANLLANYQNNNRWALTPIDRRYIEADGTRILPEHQHLYLINEENGAHYHGLPGPAIYTFQFSPTLRAGIELGSTNQARLVITWAAGLGANQMTDVYGHMHNFMSQYLDPQTNSVHVSLTHSNVA